MQFDFKFFLVRRLSDFAIFEEEMEGWKVEIGNDVCSEKRKEVLRNLPSHYFSGRLDGEVESRNMGLLNQICCPSIRDNQSQRFLKAAVCKPLYSASENYYSVGAF